MFPEVEKTLSGSSSVGFCRTLFRSAVANFLLHARKCHPWWVSIVHDVTGHPNSNISSLVGLPFELCMKIFCIAGLCQEKKVKDGLLYTANVDGWKV
jgi:hypothetical protein